MLRSHRGAQGVQDVMGIPILRSGLFPGASAIPSLGVADKPVSGSEECGSGQRAVRLELMTSWTGTFKAGWAGENVGNLLDRFCWQLEVSGIPGPELFSYVCGCDRGR